MLQNVDVLVLGRHDPASSGSYGAVSVACKSLVLIAFVLAGFLLPEAATRRAAGHHALTPAARLAGRSSPSRPRCCSSLAVSEGHELLSLAFGKRLAGASAAFAPLALAMTLLATSVVLTHYLLAAGSRAVLVGAARRRSRHDARPRPGRHRPAAGGVDRRRSRRRALAVALGGLVALHHRSVHRRSGRQPIASGLVTPPFQPTLARSRALFRAFGVEQTDPAHFYGMVAADSAAHVGYYAPLAGKLLLDVGGGPGYFADAFRAAARRIWRWTPTPAS